MHRLGLIGKKTGERAGRFSDWCWFAVTLIALVELSFERNVTAAKLQSGKSYHTNFIIFIIFYIP